MSDIAPQQVIQDANEMREIMAAYQDAEDLITIGAYKAGQNLRVDRAVQRIDAVQAFLKQAVEAPVSLAETWAQMRRIVQG
jgi:flagellum-specific ATP synthase